MRPFSRKAQLWIGLVLTVLLVVTRDYHFATFRLLPSASWAVFFLAGAYLASLWVFPALLAAATLLDYLAVNAGGVSSFCISPAYAFLVPAYGVLWLAGRLYAGTFSRARFDALALGSCVLGGTVVCEIVSSGSFYFLSGRFASPTISGFVPRFAQYFPSDLGAVLFYVGIAIAVHIVAFLVLSATERRVPRGPG